MAYQVGLMTIFHQNLIEFYPFGVDFGVQGPSRRLRERPGSVPGESREGLGASREGPGGSGRVFGWSGEAPGTIQEGPGTLPGAKIVPKSCQNGPQIDPSQPRRVPKSPPNRAPFPDASLDPEKVDLGSVSGPFWDPFLVVLRPRRGLPVRDSDFAKTIRKPIWN